MKTFQEMDLPESLQHTLQHMQFNEPTPVQSEAIPLALEGKDILGSAQTGTGKTGAFGIPLVAKVITDPNILALVVTPTRELGSTGYESVAGHSRKKDQKLEQHF